jgi:hypothetical protein
MKNKLFGRRPRGFNHKIPHMSAMLLGSDNSVFVPPSINYAPDTVSNFGMMLNDQLGDCTCAAVYHSIQIWSLNAQGSMLTEPDNDVLSLYEQACGYSPADPSTDQGGVEQSVLSYLLNNGAPMSSGAPHKISAFYEVDPRNTKDVKQTIYECGVAYIGIDVPANIMPDDGMPPQLWQVVPNQEIIGGHAIALTGYNATGPFLISWGQKFQMTWDFFNQYTDEVYGIVDSEWIAKTGKTPCGMTLVQLEQMMQSMK